MTYTGETLSTFNARIVALRFFFGMTCGREDMKRYLQFRIQPGKLPLVPRKEAGANFGSHRPTSGNDFFTEAVIVLLHCG